MSNLFSRRETLRLLGAAGASAFIGLPETGRLDVSGIRSPGALVNNTLLPEMLRSALFGAAARETKDASQLTCVTKPALTEGPYFVDELLNRSDIRSDPSTGVVKPGVPFRLTINVYRAGTSACTPLVGALVDLWHCDALGVYSDVSAGGGNPDTRGQKFLRGYQVTDSNGSVQFQTIYPGYYTGRTTHLHFKVRLFAGTTRTYEFTSQLCFDDSLTDQVYTQAPYNTKPARGTRNNNDNIYQSAGTSILLNVNPDGQGGHASTFDLGLAGLPASLQSVATVAATNYSPDAVTRDGIAALFGSDLAVTTAAAASLTLPVTLGGIQVLLRDAGGTQRAAGLFYVSPTQINFQVPTMTSAGDAVLSVLRDGSAVGQGTAEIHSVAPTWFTANTDGTGVPAALVQRITSTGMTTYEPIAQWDAAQSRYVAVPIDLGAPTDTVTFVGFGCGFRNRSSLSSVSATIGGVNAEVLYAGSQGTYVGLDQGNITIPRSLEGRGNVELEFNVDGRKANTVTVNIK